MPPLISEIEVFAPQVRERQKGHGSNTLSQNSGIGEHVVDQHEIATVPGHGEAPTQGPRPVRTIHWHVALTHFPSRCLGPLPVSAPAPIHVQQGV